MPKCEICEMKMLQKLGVPGILQKFFRQVQPRKFMKVTILGDGKMY